jgi:hypothetical protein
VSRDIYPTLSIAISKIYKDGGIGAFYAGISPTLIGMLPYSTCYYFMYDTMKTSYCKGKNKKSLNRPEMLLIGAFSGEKPSIFQINISFQSNIRETVYLLLISKLKCGDLSYIAIIWLQDHK